MKEKISPYIPGLILLLIGLVIGLLTYKDYGMGWDEPYQRGPGILNYNYAFHGNPELFQKETDNHGAGFELFLLFFEKGLGLKDSRDIYMNRHIITNVFFLLSAFAGYVLVLRLFKNDRFLASLGFILFAFTPRLYAHSFFNSKDIPFYCMLLITLALSRAAFDRQKPWLFLLAGLAAGYGTSIRIMGIMLLLFIGIFLLIDVFDALKKKEKVNQILVNLGVFAGSFVFALYISWPYLWRKPLHNFVASFSAMSHYKWANETLINGKMVVATHLSWTYIPIWFVVTTPLLWLVAGFAGIGWLVYQMSGSFRPFLSNTRERNFLLYLLCFFVPVISVIVLHSVMYDDWRHLFFIYPPFVLLALYFLHVLLQKKYKVVVQALCGIQVAALLLFMVRNHPFHHIYFNELVSHEDEYLRRNYELDYWGCSFKQALDHIVETDSRKDIKVCSNLSAYIENNTLMLLPEDRARVRFTAPDSADYFITNYRGHPDDYPGANIDFSISVQNSSIVQIFKLRNINYMLH